MVSGSRLSALIQPWKEIATYPSCDKQGDSASPRVLPGSAHDRASHFSLQKSNSKRSLLNSVVAVQSDCLTSCASCAPPFTLCFHKPISLPLDIYRCMPYFTSLSTISLQFLKPSASCTLAALLWFSPFSICSPRSIS